MAPDFWAGFNLGTERRLKVKPNYSINLFWHFWVYCFSHYFGFLMLLTHKVASITFKHLLFKACHLCTSHSCISKFHLVKVCWHSSFFSAVLPCVFRNTQLFFKNKHVNVSINNSIFTCLINQAIWLHSVALQKPHVVSSAHGEKSFLLSVPTDAEQFMLCRLFTHRYSHHLTGCYY